MTRATAKKQIAPAKPPRQKRTLSENDVRALVHDIISEMGLDDHHRTVKEVAKQAVEETLMSIGVDTKNPLQAQASFAALRNLVGVFSDPDFQADLQHLRAWRVSVSQARSKGILTAVGAAVTGALFLFILGLKGWVIR
jgi:hypothetical protein